MLYATALSCSPASNPFNGESESEPGSPLGSDPHGAKPGVESLGRLTQLVSPGASYVTNTAAADRFVLASGGQVAPWAISAQDFPGVARVARQLQADVQRVTGVQPTLSQTAPSGKHVVMVGTIGKSPLIDGLVQAGKLDVTDLKDRWDTFVLQVVEAPLAGVERALVIAGSNKRGTLYGMYDLAEQIGVSPWYYWADVPARKQTELHVLPGRHTLGEPKIKYRGFFINDENPALLGWVNATFRGFNAQFYEKVFELLMRMKGNYLWPAMWGKAFQDDDPQNAALADEYGVVMGTSHHEPMMRAQAEWEKYGSGAWDYQSNQARLRTFWEESIRRMGTKESLVTVGMRGDGDVAGTANRQQLEKIITDQRAILQSVSGRDPATIPQVWTLYKEVQDYYDQGMKVPDDITLMFSDDNFGNVRKLPKVNAPKRAGGYGVYYHYDYVGDPRNYKWINTNPIGRVWEQMDMSYRYGADKIWIVNVGDIKPMEFPLHFFMEFAWNPDRWPAESLPDYTRLWAEKQFGAEHAPAIANILSKYSRFNGRRKPELLDPSTYSQIHFREAERVVDEYNALAVEAQTIHDALPTEFRAAFYQLVLYPVAACANLNDLYVSAGKNALYARQGRASANTLASRVRTLFTKDSELSRAYHGLNGGKWNHMMDQTHIGYTNWQEPAQNTAPQVREVTLGANAQMGVAIEGSESVWPGTAKATLPELSPFRPDAIRYIDVFNRGRGSFAFTATSSVPWVTVTPASGMVETEQRLSLKVDWSAAPLGKQEVAITITGPNNTSASVQAPVHNPESPRPEQVIGSVEADGSVSVEAEHFSKAVETAEVRWQRVPELGRTLSGMTVTPATAAAQPSPKDDSPHLEYRMHLFHEGEVRVRAYVSPTLRFGEQALRYAVSFDDAAPKIVNIHTDTSDNTWRKWVSDAINVSVSTHSVKPGERVLKLWMVDPGVVVQKLVVETTDTRASYLGPPSVRPAGLPMPMAGAPGGGASSGGASGQGGNGGALAGNGPTAGTGTNPSGGAGTQAPGSGAGTSSTASPGGNANSSGGTGAGGGAGNAGTIHVGNSSANPGIAGAGQATPPGSASSDSGCGCRVPASQPSTSRHAWLGVALALGAAARRRRVSSARIRRS